VFPYLVLAAALLVGLILIGRWFATADPAVLARVFKWIFGGAIVLAGVFLAGTGKLVPAAMLGSTLIPLILRWRVMANRMKSARGPTAGRTSAVETDYLRARLDHDSGAMTGDVLKGVFAGRRLEALSDADLLALLAECRDADPRGAAILEAYLDRGQGAEWREGEPNAGPGASMTRDEALEILGLAPGASAGAIKEAHRDLIRKLHPDHGGSTYLAAKINQAKDLLLGG